MLFGYRFEYDRLHVPKCDWLSYILEDDRLDVLECDSHDDYS
jgi:hypothetical protein